MERIPKVVRERLQAGMPAGIHPDANILAAFAECSLTDRERASVLKHLALCRDCRDVVTLALPEVDATTVFVPAPHWWTTWTAFRWGFVTAGVAIIALGTVEYQRHSRPSMMARQISRPEAVAVNLQQPAAAPQPSPSAPRAERAGSEGAKVLAKSSSADGLARMQPSAAPAVNQFHGYAHSISGATHGPNMPVQWQQQQQVPSRVQAFASVPSLRQQGSNAAGGAQSAQMVAVQPQAAAVSSEARNAVSPPAPPPTAPTEQMFDNLPSPAIDKAKAAVIQPVTVSSPRWSITSIGELQRSFDQGNTWQSVDVNALSAVAGNFARSANADSAVVEARAKLKDADKKAKPAAPVFRAVVANGSDVWAGGTNGALYHSIDSGNRWNRIIPSVNGSALTADIVALQFSDPQHGTLTTSTPEVWTTSDGGQTWQKQ